MDMIWFMLCNTKLKVSWHNQSQLLFHTFETFYSVVQKGYKVSFFQTSLNNVSYLSSFLQVKLEHICKGTTSQFLCSVTLVNSHF